MPLSLRTVVEFESVSLLVEATVVVEPAVVVVDGDAVVVAPTTLSLLLLSLASLLILCVTCKGVVAEGAAVVVAGSAVSVVLILAEEDAAGADVDVSSLTLAEEDAAGAVVETQTQLNVWLLGSGGVPALTVAARVTSIRVSLANPVKTEGDRPRSAITQSIVGLTWKNCN